MLTIKKPFIALHFIFPCSTVPFYSTVFQEGFPLYDVILHCGYSVNAAYCDHKWKMCSEK